MIGYIYSIINTINNKRYVGKTTNLEKRIAKHFTELKGGYHHSHKLQRAYNKYGKEAFKVEYKEYNLNSESDLNQFEIETIALHNSYYNGYNETLGGEGNSTKFDFSESVLIYQIGQRYEGVIKKLARFYKCDDSTISAIFKKNILKTVDYNLDELNNLIHRIGLTEENLKENYKNNYSRQLTTQQVLGILATLEIKKYTQAACAQVCGVKKDLVGNIVRGKTYKEDVKIYNSLSKEEKQKYCDDFCLNTDVEKIHFSNKRAVTKNALTQEQVDYILDNVNKMTNTQIAKDLSISTDRVSGIKNKKYYLDLIHDYELRHSSN